MPTRKMWPSLLDPPATGEKEFTIQGVLFSSLEYSLCTFPNKRSWKAVQNLEDCGFKVIDITGDGQQHANDNFHFLC